MLHTSLLKTTVVAFTVLPLGSYAPMLSLPFKTLICQRHPRLSSAAMASTRWRVRELYFPTTYNKPHTIQFVILGCCYINVESKECNYTLKRINTQWYRRLTRGNAFCARLYSVLHTLSLFYVLFITVSWLVSRMCLCHTFNCCGHGCNNC
jgi:hypothetical protein